MNQSNSSRWPQGIALGVSCMVLLGGTLLLDGKSVHRQARTTAGGRQHSGNTSEATEAAASNTEALIRRLRATTRLETRNSDEVPYLTESQWDEMEETLSLMIADGNAAFAREIETILADRQRVFNEKGIVDGIHPFYEDDLFEQHRHNKASSNTVQASPAQQQAWHRQMRALDWAVEYSRNLELVTALRRLQNKPDPIHVIVDDFSPGRVLQWGDMPSLGVSLRNLDVHQRPVGLTVGGDYRSGRLSRFRIQIRNAQSGELMRSKELTGIQSIIGGGIYRSGQLRFGEGWNTTLNVGDYIATLPPGQYLLKVLYHNQRTIDSLDSLWNRICCQSKEMQLIVTERTVRQNPQATKRFQRRLAAIDRSQHVQVLESKFGGWAREYIPWDSPLGHVLRSRWSIVPVLLDELNDPEQSPESRAHTLAMLYSITGQVDPRDPIVWKSDGTVTSALGPYETIRPSGVSSAEHEVVGLPKKNSETDSKSDSGTPITEVEMKDSPFRHLEELINNTTVVIDTEKQSKLVAKWKSLRKWICVVETEGGFGSDAKAYSGGGFF